MMVQLLDLVSLHMHKFSMYIASAIKCSIFFDSRISLKFQGTRGE